MKPDPEQVNRWICDAQNDVEAFRHLFEAFYHPIYNYVLRRTRHNLFAQDITANTFVQAMNHIKRFHGDGRAFSSWLYRIATNEINQMYRKNKRLVALTDGHQATLKSEKESDQAILAREEDDEKKEKYNRVHRVIAELKPRYQTVLSLRYFENMSLGEISEILEIPENTVKTRIRRGIKQLKERL